MKKKTAVRAKPKTAVSKSSLVDKSVVVEAKSSTKNSTGSNNTVESDYASIIVKVISVLGCVGSALMFLMGIAFLIYGKFIVGLIPTSDIPANYITILPALMIVMAIVLIVFSVAWFVVSLNLWKLKNWARIVAIVFASLGVLNALISLPSGLIGVLLHGAVLYFLAFDPNVRKLFE